MVSKKKENKPIREYDGVDLMGQKIYPGNLVAVSSTSSKTLRIGIVAKMAMSKRYLNERRITLITKPIWGKKEPKTVSMIYEDDSVVKIGNPVFNLGVTNVGFIMENISLLRSKYFDSSWKPGDTFGFEEGE